CGVEGGDLRLSGTYHNESKREGDGRERGAKEGVTVREEWRKREKGAAKE
ncbi:hypothetical protein TorRG33x02_032730, partial [Trema orientale]